MAISTIIDEVKNAGAYLVVRVTLTDGATKVRPDEYHILTELELKQKINADIAKLSTSATEFPKIVPGPYDPTFTPPAETQAQKDRRLYLEALTKYRQYLYAASLTMPIDTADRDATLQFLIDSYKDEYLNMFNSAMF